MSSSTDLSTYQWQRCRAGSGHDYGGPRPVMTDYYLSLEPQRSEAWFRLRLGRLTVSNLAAALNKSKFTQPAEVVHLMNGGKKTFTPEQEFNMQRGALGEPVIRDWYSQTFSRSVEEVGLAVPCWDPRLGASLDGESSPEHGIEIKVVKKLYYPLIQHAQAVSRGFKPPEGSHQHIYDSHYLQMLGGAVITGKKTYTYIVTCPDEGRTYTEEFKVNYAEWWEEIYPAFNRFWQEFYIPLSQSVSLPRIDPPFNQI